MAICKIEKKRHYVTMSNYHLRDMNLSNKARGLLSTVFQLPENWDYTVRGLASICKDCTDSINAQLKELERCGYLVRRRIRDTKGRMLDVEYTFYEFPQQAAPNPNTPYTEKPDMEVPYMVFPSQYIDRTNIDNNLNIKKSILSYPIKEDAMRNDVISYREKIKENIEFDILLSEMPHSSDMLFELLDLIVDTVCTSKETVRISGIDYPADQVKEQFLKLRADHIRYVCECMNETTSKIRNIRQYLLAALYNAPTTIHNYYAAQVRHDMENNAYD